MTVEALRERWATAGALPLTGWPDAPPLLPPDGVLSRIAELGRPLGVDAFELVAERASHMDLRRGGRISCGGATRLLPATDGWVAVSLARPDDWVSVPAWLGLEADGEDWSPVEAAVATRSATDVVERGALLGLPIARQGEVGADRPAVVSTELGSGSIAPTPLVVDLSSLWAGPLCARLLRGQGMRSLKMESVARPDGARRGSPSFFAVLNPPNPSAFESVDLDEAGGVERLRDLLLSADVVIEASRPRALEQLGIDAADVVADGHCIWVSITGYGRDEPGRNRVAFGDDAAVAGGLVAVDPDFGPCFVADAIADPLTGMVAAAAVLEAYAEGRRCLLDVSMSAVAAHVARDGGAFTPVGRSSGR